ncbi:MAG: HD-GYP domain-containing protein [Peptostreptococcaceae bacterium]
MAYKQKILNGKSLTKSMLYTLESNLQLKNIETKEHTERVHDYCLKLGEKLNLDEETIEELLLVAKFHDIGKIGVSESILLKKGKLTEDEYEIMKTHSEKGYRLTLLIPELSHISRSILTHHERWDGKGYPLGLREEEIPLIARIVCVVDAYDAMTNNRVYSKKVEKSKAIKELKRCSGTQFDPYIVKVFCDMIENM